MIGDSLPAGAADDITEKTQTHAYSLLQVPRRTL
jgi:hypothetical protein